MKQNIAGLGNIFIYLQSDLLAVSIPIFLQGILCEISVGLNSLGSSTFLADAEKEE